MSAVSWAFLILGWVLAIIGWIAFWGSEDQNRELRRRLDKVRGKYAESVAREVVHLAGGASWTAEDDKRLADYLGGQS